MQQEGKSSRSVTLVSAFTVSVLIALAVVARRAVALAIPNRPARPGGLSLDANFAAHAALTAVHIAPAAIFILSAIALVFSRKPRRWLHLLFYATGLCTGLTALAMSRYPIGGWIEQAATCLFGCWFLFSLFRSFQAFRLGDLSQERQWSLRSIGVALGIATTRPVIGLFFATSRLTGWGPADFFGPAFFIGFMLNTLAVELWLGQRARAGSVTASGKV